MRVILDLDDTLLDTTRFKHEHLFPTLTSAHHTLTLETIEAAYLAARRSAAPFSLATFIRTVLVRSGIESSERARALIDAAKAALPTYVRHDILAHAKRVGPTCTTILTLGEPEYQHFKIEHAGLLPHVGRVLAVTKSKHEVLRALAAEHPTETHYFYDDAPGNFLTENPPHNIVQVRV